MNTVDRLIELADKATSEASEWNTTEPASEKWKANKVNNAAFVREANPETVKRLCELVKEAKQLLDDGPCSCNGYGDRPCESCDWLAKLERLEKGSGE